MKEMSDIIRDKIKLDEDLHQALSTMEKSDKIKIIRKLIRENQNECPHFSTQFNWVMIDGICPYCGKKIAEE